MKSSTPSWLVKSSGRVLGPFPATHIEDLLRDREIVVLDECATPFRRFRCIRDLPEFSNIVEQLRRESTSDIGEKTLTESFTLQTASVTEPLHPDSSYSPYADITRANPKEIVIEKLAETTTVSRGSSASRYQYGGQGEKSASEKAKLASQWMWWFTSLILLMVLGFVAFTVFIQRPKLLQQSVQDLVLKGENYIEEGLLSEAHNTFSQAHSLDPGDTSFFHYLAPLIIQFDNQTVKGKRMLEEILVSQPNFATQIYTGIGLADLREEKLQDAEGYFKRALAGNRDYIPAIVNLGVTALKENEYDKALERFKLALSKGTDDGAVHLLIAEALIQKAQQTKNLAFLDEALVVLQKIEVKILDYRQEALILIAYLQSITDKQNEAEETLRRFLAVDPLLTDLHTHNIFVARFPVEWSNLLSYCLPLSRTLPPSGQLAAASALCYMKARKPQEANTEIQAALQRSPRDPLVQSTAAFIFESSGQENAGGVALGRALEYDRGQEFLLPLILQARLYFSSGDYTRAEEYWQKILNKEATSLQAHAGLAQIAFHKDQQGDFRRHALAAQRISNDYIPVKSLMVRARRQGWEI